MTQSSAIILVSHLRLEDNRILLWKERAAHLPKRVWKPRNYNSMSQTILVRVVDIKGKKGANHAWRDPEPLYFNGQELYLGFITDKGGRLDLAEIAFDSGHAPLGFGTELNFRSLSAKVTSSETKRSLRLCYYCPFDDVCEFGLPPGRLFNKLTLADARAGKKTIKIQLEFHVSRKDRKHMKPLMQLLQ